MVHGGPVTASGHRTPATGAGTRGGLHPGTTLPLGSLEMLEPDATRGGGMLDVGGQEAVRAARRRLHRGNTTTTLLLGDAHPAARHALRALFDGDPAFRVRGDAGNGHALLRLARERRPDVVVMDADLPGPHLLDVVRRLVEDQALPLDVVLLVSERGLADGRVLGAARAGVRGFLCRGQRPQEIVSGVREVAGGGIAVSPDVVGQLLDALRGAPEPAPARDRADVSRLTPRERQVFRLVAQGLTNQQISHVLVLSEGTVKSYFNRVCHKLALRNRVDAVILAYETGIVGTLTGHHSMAKVSTLPA